MMKKFSFVLIFVLLVSLCGCSLAQEDTGETTGETASDKLIGAFVTLEHLDLFDFEGYLNDHLSEVMEGGLIEGDTSAYQGRIYATKIEAEDPHDIEYVFEDLEGYYLFSPTIYGEELNDTYITILAHSCFSDIESGAHSIDDNILEQTIEGTIYVTEGMDYYQFYLNPIFQDEQGRVYLVSGNSFSTNSMGESSMSNSSEFTTTVDGVETTHRGSVKVNYVGVPRAEKILVLQMDAQSNVLSRQEYAPGTLPKEITPADGTDYFLVETHSKSGVTRELFGSDTENLKTYVALEDGICDCVLTKILWAE